MGKILLLMLIIGTGVSALVRPWIGIASYYLLSLLGPQYIWWWTFEGVRVSLLVAGFAITGICFNLFKGTFDFSFLKTRLNFYILSLWFFLTVSFLFGPYIDQYTSGGRTPAQIFSLMNNMFLFYFCSTLVIDDLKKIRYLSFVMVVTTIILTYWANNQYFSSNWYQFNTGRLMGPYSMDGGSMYMDENTFAMIFVTGMPFVYYWVYEIQRKWIRYLLWAIIPFAWHAIFLTGSRGGLLGIGVVMLYILFISKRKFLALPLMAIFILFYNLQGGSLMKERSDQIVNYEGDDSAESRITAWKGSVKLISACPITGVGIGSFITAIPVLNGTKPMVAHNTFIQYTAESGIGAGVAYIMIALIFIRNSRNIRIWCKQHENKKYALSIDRYNNASTVSFAGLIVCSFFLSLNTYEVYFFLLVINNCLSNMCLNNNKLKSCVE